MQNATPTNADLIVTRIDLDKLATSANAKIDAIWQVIYSTSEQVILDACFSRIDEYLSMLGEFGVTRQGDGNLSRPCESFEATKEFPVGSPIAV